MKSIIVKTPMKTLYGIQHVEYDITEFEIMSDLNRIEYLHYIGDGKNIKNPKGNISCYSMFKDCENETLDLSSFDTQDIRNMNSMFYNCNNIKMRDLSNFDTSRVENIDYMFDGCNCLETLYFPGLSSCKLKNVGQVFDGCSNLKIFSKDGFITLINLRTFYGNCCIEYDSLNFEIKYDYSGYGYLHYIGDGENVINPKGNITCYRMFENFSGISLDLSKFDSSKVVDMSKMFSNCSSLKHLNIVCLNTSKVENMSDMFFNCKNLSNLDLSNFDTSKVKSMHSMFEKCLKLEYLDLSSFTTNNLLDMSKMFKKCRNLKKLNLINFNTYYIRMDYAFQGCKKPCVISEDDRIINRASKSLEEQFFIEDELFNDLILEEFYSDVFDRKESLDDVIKVQRCRKEYENNDYYERLYKEILNEYPEFINLIYYIKNVNSEKLEESIYLNEEMIQDRQCVVKYLADIYLKRVLKISYKVTKQTKIELNETFSLGIIGFMKCIDNYFFPEPDNNYYKYCSFDNYFSTRVKRYILDNYTIENNYLSLKENTMKKMRAFKILLDDFLEYEKISIEDVEIYKDGLISFISQKDNKLYYDHEEIDFFISCIQNNVEMIDNYNQEKKYMTNQSIFREAINYILEYLNENEEKILRMRYGLDDGIPMTLEQVSSVIGLTRERVRQIEKEAVEKLRSPYYIKILKNYI
ncbi:MAG: sigma-70 family RNA polymerase sigma factor [Floccifex sp.]|nr:sigma-70 family RNA polymerase sigma factor [Floccifex sp.]